MKVHYINILMLAVPLNIFVTLCRVYNQRNHKSITHHTQNENPIKTHRSLCECELFAPQNYDNDPEMKSVMQDFDRQTSQRLREYDERMNKNRQKCKDQCDKDIQKIILKDKIEKELKEKLATLEANINTKDLPICECEKSLTEKVEKGCLGCGVLGSGIAPNVGLFGEVVLGAWKTAVLVSAKELAKKAGFLAGEAERIKTGVETVISELYSELGVQKIFDQTLETFINPQNYNNSQYIYQAINIQHNLTCLKSGTFGSPDSTFCTSVVQKTLVPMHASDELSASDAIKITVNKIVADSKSVSEIAAEVAAEEATNLAIKTNNATVNATYVSSQTAIIVSIVAILVIVLVMVIIYLILRYRRKKKMKKKLQYIKLLKE